MNVNDKHGEIAMHHPIPAADAAAALRLLATQPDGDVLAEALGLAPYEGFDTRRTAGGAPVPVTRVPNIELGA